MSTSSSITPPSLPPPPSSKKGPAPRPPRIAINPMAYASYPSTAQPQIPGTAGTAAPNYNWTTYANPFNMMYSQKAGAFMTKGFEGFVDFTKSGLSFGEKTVFWLYEKISKWSKKWFTHIFLFLVVFLYSVGGALIFKAVEEPQARKEFDAKFVDKHNFFNAITEAAINAYKEDIMRPHHYNWQQFIVDVLRDHKDTVEDILETNETVKAMNEFQNPWTFWNSMFYCGTIYTTIGYGHIAPKTTLGRGITIIYAIIGIPMFLILLADFGKLFTRMIKFVWAYVRRLYYTGTCRKVRKQQQVRDVMRGMYTVYDYAIRRPSTYIIRDLEAGEENGNGEQQKGPQIKQPGTPQSIIASVHTNSDAPPTPYPETFEVDDEFNLPVSLASVILLTYIFAGASVYVMWEDWSYFESFYFVFISMSTIGFGDFVPNHPIFMMCSIIYLIFGLALTSMFINVVQIKLSDSFKQASAKIGATIGFGNDDGSSLQNQTPDTGGGDTGLPNTKLDDIPETTETPGNHTQTIPNQNNLNHNNAMNNTTVNANNENSPPPLLPRNPVNQAPQKAEKKNKRRFF